MKDYRHLDAGGVRVTTLRSSRVAIVKEAMVVHLTEATVANSLPVPAGRELNGQAR